MGLFDTNENNNDELALLRAEVERLKSQVGEPKKIKSVESERIGISSSDPVRSFAQWMQYRKRVGDVQYRSAKVQAQVARDINLLGSRFYGED